VFVLAGCGGAGEGPVAAAAASAPAAGVASPAASPSISLDTRLVAAFDGFTDGYRFDAEVKVGDKVATRAEGRRVAGNAEFVVGSGGSKVTYRTVGADTWVLRDGADWVAVDGSKTEADPLAALSAPTRVEAGPAVDGATSLVATYPVGALGLDGTGDASVAIVIGSDGSVEATYQLDTAVGPAISRTTFRPATDTTPITPPN